MIEETILTLPNIKQNFDAFLLDPLIGLLRRLEDKLVPLAQRKIRNHDVGKIKDFNKMKMEFYEVYERKEIEKEEYETKIRNAPKRPGISSTGDIAVFKRFQPQK